MKTSITEKNNKNKIHNERFKPYTKQINKNKTIGVKQNIPMLRIYINRLLFNSLQSYKLFVHRFINI